MPNTAGIMATKSHFILSKELFFGTGGGLIAGGGLGWGSLISISDTIHVRAGLKEGDHCSQTKEKYSQKKPQDNTHRDALDAAQTSDSTAQAANRTNDQ